MSIFSLQPDPQQTEEFKELLRRYGDMAYRMAYQLTGGAEAEANDLVQEVFVRIWRQWTSYRPHTMKSWMYRVLQNLHVDAIRRRGRHPSVSLDSSPSQDTDWSDRLPDGAASLESTLEQKDVQNQVRMALGRLDEDYRIPVMLCDMEGLAYEDIARILACPIGTVRSRIHRGRTQLRRMLHLTESQEVLQ